ncbi:MAG: serine/threonine protein phosphatase [Desulfuromonadales bacterium]|nr:serine/threonine protein phosphatase [Desulfuromonadales bacterium]
MSTQVKSGRPIRLIAIGDIHGQLDMLNRLLNIVSPKADDQFVFLGDYIDRGKNSRGVVERLIQFKNNFPDTIFLRGNHEQLLLDALVEISAREAPRLRELSAAFAKYTLASDVEIFLSNGGNTTLRSYRVRNMADIPPGHIEFIDSTRLWWRFENFLFVHAGIRPGASMEEQDPYVLLWERLSPPGKDGEIHIVGHNPATDGEPHFEPGRYNLDTGAVYGRTLTACDVFSKEIWQVR